MTERELLELKEEIDEAKIQQSKLQGQLEALLTQLQNDFGCQSVKQAEKLLTELEKEIAVLSNEIQTGLNELEDEYHIS